MEPVDGLFKLFEDTTAQFIFSHSSLATFEDLVGFEHLFHVVQAQGHAQFMWSLLMRRSMLMRRFMLSMLMRSRWWTNGLWRIARTWSEIQTKRRCTLDKQYALKYVVGSSTGWTIYRVHRIMGCLIAIYLENWYVQVYNDCFVLLCTTCISLQFSSLTKVMLSHKALRFLWYCWFGYFMRRGNQRLLICSRASQMAHNCY